MDIEVFRDLKQLDDRMQRVTKLLGSCIKLFDDNYSERFPGQTGSFSWPYDISGKNGLIKWPDYSAKFTANTSVSPLTNALCGWSVSKLLEQPVTPEHGLGTTTPEVAEALAKLPPERLTSATFTGNGEIFVHAQILRFLASQRLWKGNVFEGVFKRVEHVIASAHGPFHPFFLHYCVLAEEEVRNPAVRIAESILRICDLADKIEAFTPTTTAANRLDSVIDSLEMASSLRELMDSFATTVGLYLQLPKVVKTLDNLALRSSEAVTKAGMGIQQNEPATWNAVLLLLRSILGTGITQAAIVLDALPTSVVALTADEKDAKGKLKRDTACLTLREVAGRVKNRDWYSDALRERVKTEVVSQISYAASNDESRLDIGALAYSLLAALLVDALQSTNPLSRTALSLVLQHEQGGRWRDVRPMSRSAQGFVHLPLNLEIANALLTILLNYPDTHDKPFLKEIDDVMEWVSGTLNSAGSYHGWCNEHDYDPDRIDFWATAQVIQFLLNYRELVTKVIVQSTLERAGLATVRPSTSWDSLAAIDLEQRFEDQVLSKLRDGFAKPYERSKAVSSFSVLLYGPPGTSKTSLMEALSNRLNWEFLQISPADFLSAGGDQVEAKATLIFEILKRAKNLVVLFDEVDEFLVDREASGRPEGIFRFMTTSMLPKLQSLRSRRSLIFGIATNYKERLDKAITRLGRVDYDWAVLPPDFTSRVVLIKKFKSELDHEAIRKLAAETAFFSYLELKRTVERRRTGTEDNPWKIVRHPTASPESYETRPDSDDEFVTLLQTQISDQMVELARKEIKVKLAEQLEKVKPNDKKLFEVSTYEILDGLVKKLRM